MCPSKTFKPQVLEFVSNPDFTHPRQKLYTRLTFTAGTVSVTFNIGCGPKFEQTLYTWFVDPMV